MVQGGFVTVLALAAMVILRTWWDDIEWYVMACAMIFYAAVSPMIGAFWTMHFRRYVLQSIVVFLIMGGLQWLAASQLSELRISEMREVRLLLTVIVIFYFLITALSSLYRALLAYVRKM
jgi:hypothetical protein